MGSQDSTRYCSLRGLLKVSRTLKKYTKRTKEEDARHHEFNKRRREEELKLLEKEVKESWKDGEDLDEDSYRGCRDYHNQ